MRFYIIAGEKSGDLHGGGICRALQHHDPTIEIRGVGGEAMESCGASLLFRYDEIALMGFSAVLIQLNRLRKLLDRCQSDVLHFQPDVLVLIDSAGFNLKMARFVHRHWRVPVFYLIPPKTWAWGSWRNRTLEKLTDHLFVTLPFEQSYFEQQDIPVSYFGSPLVGCIQSVVGTRETFERDSVALLPGSRVHEIRSHLPLMLAVAREYPDIPFVICGLQSIDQGMYRLDSMPDNVSLVLDQSYETLLKARAAIVVSGTATLETAILRVPQVVIYQTGWVNYLLARVMMRVRFISLVNLIAGKRVVRELIQGACNLKNIKEELKQMLENANYREHLFEEYHLIDRKLSTNAGDPYFLMAEKMLALNQSGGSKLAQA